ncbi:MAG: SH3 domain-containing protein [Aquificaceae bacterium]|nr:SH3 domain-containing protein [Aquificaceae bacterium]
MNRITITLMAFASLSLSAELLYVQSLKAPLLAEPKLGSKEIASAPRGEKLRVIKKEGQWFMVEYNKTEGWTLSTLLSKQPPIEKVNTAEEKDVTRETARRRASGYTTAAAARGLIEERARANEKYRLDFEAIRWLERIKVSDEEVMNLIKEKE